MNGRLRRANVFHKGVMRCTVGCGIALDHVGSKFRGASVINASSSLIRAKAIESSEYMMRSLARVSVAVAQPGIALTMMKDDDRLARRQLAGTHFFW
jgi:hypothetical protein